MARARRLWLGVGVVSAVVAGTMTVVGGTATADPVPTALARLTGDADRALTLVGAGDGKADFVGGPARADIDNPAVEPSTGVAAAAGAHLARYGGAFGATQAGTTLERTAVTSTGVGDTVRYQQQVAGVPVLGGEVVVSLQPDRELSSILAETTDATRVATAEVSASDAEDAARAAFLKRLGGGGEIVVESAGRWLLDADLVGGDASLPDRTVWRMHVSRGVAERRQILVDDRTGGILMDTDEIAHVDRVVCDNGNVRRATELPCTSGFAQVEGGAASPVTDVKSAYTLSGAVSDVYQQVAGIDLTNLLGVSVGGVKKLASTVRWCYNDVPECPYSNAFWDGTQMYYGQGYAGADDVVGHEITHGFTERHSGLFYWGQSGAINESISDIIGEIVDHRNLSAGDSPTSWSAGEDIPGFPTGIRNLQDPTVKNDPDRTSSPLYVQDGVQPNNVYPDNDGVHDNSGVGNKTFYLISQGGSFNGRTTTGIDLGDAGLTKSAKLWLLVAQTLTSGSDYADLGAVLEQSCQALLAGGAAGFTAANCADVYQATLATELRQTPTKNPQPADAEATCPTGAKRVLFESETGAAGSKFVAAPSSWGRGAGLARTGRDSWSIGNAVKISRLALTMSSGVTLPSGQPSYLHFQQWRVLEWEPGHFFDVGTVEVDNTGDAASAVDAAGLPWVNGPQDVIDKRFGNPSTATVGFGGDSRGFLASRADLSSYAGQTVKAQFTLNTDSSTGFVGWAVDDVTIYTCDAIIANSSPPSIAGTPRVGVPLTGSPGAWTPAGVAFAYQWLRNSAPIAGATSARYTPTAADRGAALSVRVTGSREGSIAGAAVSAPTAAVAAGVLGKGKPTVKGKARVGSTLTAKGGSWKPAATLRYQWLRNGKAIRKATKAKYTLVAKDKGKRISVRATGTRTGYQPATAASKATGKVKAKPRNRR